LKDAHFSYARRITRWADRDTETHGVGLLLF
jgi:hypothetical protein